MGAADAPSRPATWIDLCREAAGAPADPRLDWKAWEPIVLALEAESDLAAATNPEDDTWTD